MSSQPPYGSYPSQNQPWPEQPTEQPSDPSYPVHSPPGAYPPPPSYGAVPYPPQYPPPPGQPAAPMYGAPNIYVQPAPYPYMVAASSDPGAGQAVASLVLGIVS